MEIVKAHSPALETFFLKAKVEGFSKARIQNYVYVFKSFKKFIGNKNIEEVNHHTIRDYLYHLHERNLAIRTIVTHFEILKTFFTFCVREEYLASHPMALIKPPKLPRQFPYVLNDSQIKKLLEAPNKKTFEGFRNYAILLMFLDTGIRRNELINLTLKDINLSNRSLNVIGKGNKQRIIYMGRLLTKTLCKWLEMRGYREYEDTLFITRNGEKLAQRQVNKIFERFKIKTDIVDVRLSPHTLRHTFASMYIKNGGDPFSLQRLLGHSDIKTVMIYVHMAGKDLREAHAKFSPVDRL